MNLTPKLFCHVPTSATLALRDEIVQHDNFKRWAPGKTDLVGVPASPIELLLLGTIAIVDHF